MKKLIIFILTLLIVAAPMFIQAGSKAVNINTADAKTLSRLSRVGPKYAERIIKYREANGPFAKPEDIKKVAGIGKKTYEINKDRIIVEEPKSDDKEVKSKNKSQP